MVLLNSCKKFERIYKCSEASLWWTEFAIDISHAFLYLLIVFLC